MTRSKSNSGARQPLSQKRPGKTALSAAPPKTAKPAASSVQRATPKSSRTNRTARTVRSSGQKPSQKAPPVSRSPRSLAEKRDVAAAVLERLYEQFPDAHCELDYKNPFELVSATILSAQCTDVRVNAVTPNLFEKYPDPPALAAASLNDIEEIIRSTGFFRAKAKSLLGMAQALVAHHDSQVPANMADLIKLPGVGRKTANVVLGNAFGINEGIVVDTHVQRISRRLGLSREPDPVGIERDLIPLFPQESWTMVSHLMIWHGRRVCFARKPACDDCVLANICASAGMPGMD